MDKDNMLYKIEDAKPSYDDLALHAADLDDEVRHNRMVIKALNDHIGYLSDTIDKLKCENRRLDLERVSETKRANELLDERIELTNKVGCDIRTLIDSFEEDIIIKVDGKVIFVPYDRKRYDFIEGNIHCKPRQQDKEDIEYTVSIDDYGTYWCLLKDVRKDYKL